MSLVAEAVAMWEQYRAGVIAELENIPEDQWDRAPAPGARTLRDLARHIVHAGVGFSSEMTRADPTFMRLFDKEAQAANMAAYPQANSKAEIIELLRTTGADAAKRLREAGDALVTRTMPFMGKPVSVLTALGFALSHEMYHRGQIATYARIAGRVPALTTQLEAMAQRQART